jgi:hypothetical protein
MSIAVGDWNGDKRLDLAVADTSKPAVWMLLGNGDGSFAEASRLDTNFAPVGVAGADFNKDGRLDLTVAVVKGTLIYLGNGDGSFTHAGDYYNDITRSGFSADFNNDGMMDFVTARRLFLGFGTGRFAAYQMPSPRYDDSWVMGVDVNGDGWLDVVAADHAAERIDVYLNTGGSPLRASR